MPTSKGRTPTRVSWERMVSRCHSPRDKDFPRYGGVGIVVCDAWRESFNRFFLDMGPRPTGTTLDRIDGAGNYEPSNCRWSTPTEQARNRKDNVLIEHAGVTRTIAEWAEVSGLERKTLQYRIRAGWSAARALSTPPTISRKNHGT